MNKLTGTLGMANRARKLAVGDSVIKSIQSKKAYLILIDTTIGENMKKKLMDKCMSYQIDYIFINHEVFQEVFGLKNIKSLAVLDKGFADSIQSCVKG